MVRRDFCPKGTQKEFKSKCHRFRKKTSAAIHRGKSMCRNSWSPIYHLSECTLCGFNLLKVGADRSLWDSLHIGVSEVISPPLFLCVYLRLFCLIFSISSSCLSPSFPSRGDLSPPTSSENTGTGIHSITSPFPLLFLFFFLPSAEYSSAVMTWKLVQPCNAIVTVVSVRSFPSPTLEMLQTVIDTLLSCSHIKAPLLTLFSCTN